MFMITRIYKYSKPYIVMGACLVCCWVVNVMSARAVDLIAYDDGTCEITGIYGNHHITDPAICDLIRTPEFQRLQGVHQYGPWAYVVCPSDFTRWEHSLGVFLLTWLYGGSYHEQIAALLHDVSHTVFSHAGGWIYHSDYRNVEAHQDDIHSWFIENSSIISVLQRHEIAVEDVHHKRGDFPVLEQPLPDVCADRLEYNLQGAYHDGLIDAEDVRWILDSLHIDHGTWYFDNIEAARVFAYNSIYMSRNIWGGIANGVTNYLLGDMLSYAMHQGMITQDDIHFGTDDAIWQALRAYGDTRVKRYIDMMTRHQAVFFYDTCDYTLWLHSKFRGIHPYVMHEGELYPLGVLDHAFAQVFYTTAREFRYGWPLRCVHKHKELV